MVSSISSTSQDSIEQDPKAFLRLESIVEFHRALESHKEEDDENEFSSITKLASAVCSAPYSFINFITDREQWTMASNQGHVCQYIPKENSVCQYTIRGDSVFIVDDLRLDSRFKNLQVVVGEPYFVYYMGVPIRDDRGVVIGALCILDVKERWDLNDQHIKTLYHLARVLTTLIEKHKSEKKYQELSQLNSSLLSYLSHEIRNPLNTISGVFELLERSKGLSKNEQVLIDQGKIVTRHLTTLTSSVLDYKKDEFENSKREGEFFSWQTFCQEVELSMRILTHVRHLELEFIANESDSSFFSNVGYIKQIIFNIFTNALKYSDKTKIKVDMELSRENSKIRIMITNWGKVLNDEEKKNIFLPFVRLKNDEDNISDNISLLGTGIGLTIVKNLLAKMKGELTLTSTEKEGTCFAIYIPVVLSSDLKKEESHRDFSTQKNINKKMQVLLVEDNESNLMVLNTMLQSLGILADTSKSGKEAIKKLKEHRYDLILLDNHLNDMSGIEVAKRARDDRFQGAIASISANCTSEELAEYESLGMKYALAKPIRIENLQELLLKVS